MKKKLNPRTETGRFSSQHPNESAKPGFCRRNFLYISSETGRMTHKKAFVEQIEKGEEKYD